MSEALGDINAGTEDDRLETARFYVAKAICEDDVYRSLKTSLWTSTEKGNERFDLAFREHSDTGPIYLAVAVVSSGYFLGVCELISHFTIGQKLADWVGHPDPSGYFSVRWRYVKDIPNRVIKNVGMRHRSKAVTRYHNAEELPHNQGAALLTLFRNYRPDTSLLDDFDFYTQRLGAEP